MSALHEASFSEQPVGRVRCTLCPHDCRIAEGSREVCSVRLPIAGIEMDAMTRRQSAA
jgi:hypothetical protein